MNLDCPATSSGRDVKASLHFLKHDPLYEDEKPFILRYVPDGVKELSQSNVKLEKVDSVDVVDLRPLLSTTTFEGSGIGVFELETGLSRDDFFDPVKVEQIYLPQLADRVSKVLRATKAWIIPHAVGSADLAGPASTEAQVGHKMELCLYKIRKRHAEFPVSTGVHYEYEQPTNVAHVDASLAEAFRAVGRAMPTEEAELVRKSHFQWINVWKPLRGPLTDWPLALCNMSSVQFSDLEPSDLVFPEMYCENMQVYSNPAHRWVYLSEQTENEHLLFLQSDSWRKGIGVPHCSFSNPSTTKGEMPRESIEVKLLVRY